MTSLCTLRLGEEGRLCMNLVQILINAYKYTLYNGSLDPIRDMRELPDSKPERKKHWFNVHFSAAFDKMWIISIFASF